VQVLDQGYVEHIETWGSDERIIEAARMSTDKGFQGWGPFCPDCHEPVVLGEPRCAKCGSASTRIPGDEKLLRFLWEHKHATPFEMAGLVIEVQAPIFVFREWHRHRTQSYNELSSRYTALPDLYYLPSIERLMNGMQGQQNKQGSQSGFSEQDAKSLQRYIHQVNAASRQAYMQMLDQGVARELARIVVPVAQYSRMRASANLRNWLAFLTLRMATNAQWEIRQYANAVGTIIAERFPRTWQLFAS
jgi:thymidylate synthase (FAD)